MSDRANLAKPINARHLLLRQPKTGSVASEAPENKCNNRDALHGRAPARSGVAHLKKLRTWEKKEAIYGLFGALLTLLVLFAVFRFKSS